MLRQISHEKSRQKVGTNMTGKRRKASMLKHR